MEIVKLKGYKEMMKREGRQKVSAVYVFGQSFSYICWLLKEPLV